MKYLFLASLHLLFSISSKAQSVAINTDGSSANASALLDVKSTTRGMLVPRMDSAQRANIPNPANALLVYQTDKDSGFYHFDGTNWQLLLNTKNNLWKRNGINIYNHNLGNVGIGTINPLTKLHVLDSSVLFSASGDTSLVAGNIPISGAGKRMMWYSDKAAFRAGYVDGNQWNKDSIGSYSVAMGKNNRTKGLYSFATGHNNTAINEGTVAFGQNNRVFGEYSIVGGTDNSVNSFHSFVFGYQNYTDTAYFGNGIIGTNNVIFGDYSMAVGELIDLGSYSYGFGKDVSLFGGQNFGVGEAININGTMNNAFGLTQTANGSFNLLNGSNNEVDGGDYNFLSGDAHSVINNGFHNTLFGLGNVSTGNHNLITGNGNSVSSLALPPQSNAFNIIAGESNTLAGLYNQINGDQNEVSGLANVVFGTNNSLDDNSYSIALGIGNFLQETQSNLMIGMNSSSSNSQYNFSIGQENFNANGNYNAIIGQNNNIGYSENSLIVGSFNSSSNSTIGTNIILGNNNSVEGVDLTFTVGKENNINSEGGATIGNNNFVFGDNSYTLGYHNDNSGANSFALGSLSSVDSNFCVAIGNGLKVNNNYATVMGKFNDFSANNLLFAIGNGTDLINRNNALTILNNGHLGIGTTTPTEKLEISGKIKITDGNQALDHVLVSDAAGVGTWQSPSNFTKWQSNGSDIQNSNVGNVGIGIATPANYGHGGTNKILEINNNHTANNAQSQLMLSSNASATNYGSIGGVNWIARNSIFSDKRMAFIGSTFNSLGGDLKFWTNNNGSLTQQLLIEPAGKVRIEGITAIGTNTNSFSIGGNGHVGVDAPGVVNGRFVILENGNTGIGTPAPTDLLSVNGTASKPGGGSWATFSDIRTKKNIAQFNDGLNVIKQLNPITFQYNNKSGYADSNKTFIGFSAQDVEKVAPYMVQKIDDSKNSGLSDKRSFDESALTKILVNAVKEQQILIENQQKQIDKLTKIVEVLQKEK